MKKLNSLLSSWAGLAGICSLLGILAYQQVQISKLADRPSIGGAAYKVGDKFPELEGHRVGGGKEKLPTSGLFYFYSPSCHWCTANAPGMKILSSKVPVIGISLQDISTKEYIKEHSMNFPNYVKAERLPAIGTPLLVEVSGGMVTDVTIGAWARSNKSKIEKRYEVVLPEVE